MVGTRQKLPNIAKDTTINFKALVQYVWDARDKIFIYYLEKEQTITKGYFATLLDILNKEIKKKTLPIAKKNVPFHQSTAWSHTSV